MSILRDSESRTQYSAWRLADILLMLAVCFFGCLPALLYPYCKVLWGLAALWLVIAFTLPRLYDKGYDRSAAFRVCTGVLRGIGYLVIAGGMLMSFGVSGKRREPAALSAAAGGPSQLLQPGIRSVR